MGEYGTHTANATNTIRKEDLMRKKIADDDVRKDINDIYDLLNSIKKSIDILTKVSENIAGCE